MGGVDVIFLALFAWEIGSSRGTSCNKTGRFGRDCRLRCNCETTDLGYKLHKVKIGDCRGRCTACYTRFASPPLCQKENVAYKKPTSQTSVVSSGGREASLAVDGYPGTGEHECTLTSPGNWSSWRVDFGAVRLVNSIYIYHNQAPCAGFVTCADRSRGFEIYLFNSSSARKKRRCYRHQNSSLAHITTQRVRCTVPMPARFLEVRLKNEPLSICEIQVFECADYTFGEDCDKQCNCLQSAEVCHKVTGRCTTGCRAGFRGDDCLIACALADKKFGPGCLFTCHCHQNAVCDVVTGNCSNGCHHRFYGESCQKSCNEGVYLKDGVCGQRCFCLFNEQCHVLNGKCMDGRCYSGFTGPTCHECLPWASGPRCTAANKFCPLGKTGLTCKSNCPQGTFGLACRTPCACRDANNTCNPVDGWCQYGCASGYTGHNCQLKCQPGRFGLDCNHPCRCLHNDVCDHITGTCPGPCNLKYMGPNCSILCPAFVFGPDCALECHCREFSEDCRDDFGHCRTGCMTGWSGYDCQQQTTPDSHSIPGHGCVQVPNQSCILTLVAITLVVFF